MMHFNPTATPKSSSNSSASSQDGTDPQVKSSIRAATASPKKTTNAPTRIFLVRHGQSEANASNAVAGHLDVQLTEQGRQEAQRRAEELAHHQFSHIFASDLQRAHETAKILAQPHRQSVTVTTWLRERSYGEFEGMVFDEFMTQLKPQITELIYLQSLEAKLAHKLHPSIESDLETLSRLSAFFDLVRNQHAGETVLAVSHGGVMRSLLAQLKWASHEELVRGSIKNTAYCVLQLGSSGEVEIERVVDIKVIR